MKRYGRYPARSPKPNAQEVLAGVAGDILDFLDRHGDLFLWRSEITLRYQRSLMFWSMLIITVFGLGVPLDRIPALGVRLEEFQMTFFNVGAIVVLLYHWVMYQLHQYRDTMVHELRAEFVDLAFAPKLENAMRRAEEIGRSANNEDIAKRARAIWEKIVKRSSPITIGLLRWTNALVPVLLFVAAMVILALEFRAMNIVWGIITVVPLVYRWIERKLVRRAALRDG